MAEEKQPAISKPIYDPRRAIEHVQTLQGVAPVRLFGILFPLWDVETTATQEEGREYELLEKYIERGIYEGQLHTVEALASFFGLQIEMVQKIVGFLATIGHVSQGADGWTITRLGYRSIKEGKKYVAQEKRLRFYFDAFSSMPLRKEHYKDKNVHILSPGEAAEAAALKAGGYRFSLLFAPVQWRPTALQELEARIDKAEYNVPSEMQRAQALNVEAAYLPMYLIETKTPPSGTSTPLAPVRGLSAQRPYYLVYTGIRGLYDSYLEQLVNNNQVIYAALRGEREWNRPDLWRSWLDERGITGAIPLERADGTWQVSLPATAFEGARAPFKVDQLGDYELREGYVMQLWCDNVPLRRKAALERIAQMIKRQQKYIKRQTILEQLQLQARQLQTGELELSDLQRHATDAEMQEVLKVLENL
jgi:hypothetical protein